MAEIRERKIVALARDYLGVRWKHQGRERHGLDCIGLVYRVWCDLGLDPSVDGTGYGPVSDGRQLRETIDSLLVRTPMPRPGGVLLMAQRGVHPLHLGIVSSVHTGASERVAAIIHANARERRVIEQTFLPALGLRAVAHYRFPQDGHRTRIAAGGEGG